MKKQIVETDLKKAKNWYKAEFMENDLVLTEYIGDAPIPSEPKRMNFIMIALCKKGQAQYTIDTQKVTIKPNDMIIISDRHIVDDYVAAPDLEAMCIMVSTTFYHEFIRNVNNVSSLLLFSVEHPVVTLTTREAKVYSNYYHIIKEKMADERHYYRKELVQTLLLAMFYDLSNVIYRITQQSEKHQSKADLIFTRFIGLLEQHFRYERRVGWYAIELGITPKYLSEVIKAVSKRSPNEWIDNYVVLEIRMLLKNTNKSIGEITEELHFPNQSFLGKYFKEHVGMSPSLYRKS